MKSAETPQCAFCGSVFQVGEQIFRCPECQTLYHVDCWQSCGNKCAVLGCPGAGEPDFARKPDTSTSNSDSPRILDIRIEDIDDVIELFSRPIEEFSSRITPGIWWEDPTLSILVSAFLMFLMGGVYRYTGVFLRWGTGAQPGILLQSFYIIGELNLMWWLLLGAVYGFSHYSFTNRRLSKSYRVIRTVIAITYLPLLAYQCGYALFVFEYRYPELLWGLSGKIVWLAPYMAWTLTIFAFFAAVGIYKYEVTIYFFSFGLLFCMLIIGFVATSSGIIGGLIWGGIGWGFGSLVDSLGQNNEFSTTWFSFGLSAGGNVSFILGIIQGIKLRWSLLSRQKMSIFKVVF